MTISTADKLTEAKRELAQRKRVYQTFRYEVLEPAA